MLVVNRKYLCKKSHNTCIKGEFYEIENRTSFHVTVRKLVVDYSDETFSINDIFHSIFPSFFEHFYTIQEERKLKLEKINNVGHK